MKAGLARVMFPLWTEGAARSSLERGKLGERPALLFHGGPGELLLGRPTARFARLFPRHRITPLKQAGHYFQEDTPEPVASAVLAFASDPPG